jgi:spore coat polysaccharide biosynthesis protein SpsF (cytidylyltransferase family)
MSSTRFPGKVMASFRGRPIIDHVIERVSSVVPPDQVVLATSAEVSDDLLVEHVRTVQVFRGALHDVFSRFQACLRRHPCRGFVRVCADSPLLDPEVLRRVIGHPLAAEADVVTNVFPRTFPRGHSVELIKASTFEAVDPSTLPESQREHPTKLFYENPARYAIVNIESGDASRARENFCIDTPEDLGRLEALVR